MISIYNNGYELRGLSSDIKPIEGVRNGTAFIEMDTSELYYFNDEGNIWQVWVEQGGGGGGGSTLDEQLPDIRGHIDWKDGGQAKTEISNGSGAFNLTNKNLGAAYPTGSGSSNSARGFDFRASYSNSVYKLGAVVRPNAYTVHFWRRTA